MWGNINYLALWEFGPIRFVFAVTCKKGGKRGVQGVPSQIIIYLYIVRQIESFLVGIENRVKL